MSYPNINFNPKDTAWFLRTMRSRKIRVKYKGAAKMMFGSAFACVNAVALIVAQWIEPHPIFVFMLGMMIASSYMAFMTGSLWFENEALMRISAIIHKRSTKQVQSLMARDLLRCTHIELLERKLHEQGRAEGVH